MKSCSEKNKLKGEPNKLKYHFISKQISANVYETG